MALLDISLETANRFYAWGWKASIIGAAVTFIGVFLLMWGTSVRDHNSEATMTALNVEAGEARERAGKLEERAANLERQNIDLRQKFANRRITNEQHKTLVKLLSQNPATFDIETMGDSESGLYAADILKTLTDAGWNVDKKTFPLGVIWTGLIVFQTSDPAAVNLAEALKATGIPFAIGDQHRDKVTIMVGGKPPVFWAIVHYLT